MLQLRRKNLTKMKKMEKRTDRELGVWESREVEDFLEMLRMEAYVYESLTRS